MNIPQIPFWLFLVLVIICLFLAARLFFYASSNVGKLIWRPNRNRKVGEVAEFEGHYFVLVTRPVGSPVMLRMTQVELTHLIEAGKKQADDAPEEFST